MSGLSVTCHVSRKLSALRILVYDLHDDKRNGNRLSATKFYDLFFVSRLIENTIYYIKVELIYNFKRNKTSCSHQYEEFDKFS